MGWIIFLGSGAIAVGLIDANPIASIIFSFIAMAGLTLTNVNK